MQGSTLHEETVADVVSAGLDGAGDEVLVVNPSGDTVRSLITELGEAASPPTVQLLADEALLKDLVADFLIGSAVADLQADGVLEIRTLEAVPRNVLFVSGNRVTTIVNGGPTVAGLSTDSREFVDTTYDHYASRWTAAEEFSLRTPPRSTVLRTLAEDVGPQVAADFEHILESLDVAKGNGEGLDEVTITLLVAARNGVLLYDISKWGEEVGLASKATFSRTKSRLEESGLLDTEKVPIDVGRPRLRLQLGEAAPSDPAAEELAAHAIDRLAAEA